MESEFEKWKELGKVILFNAISFILVGVIIGSMNPEPYGLGFFIFFTGVILFLEVIVITQEIKRFRGIENGI